jgi:hypothetical protein
MSVDSDGAVCGAEGNQTALWILRVSKGLCSVKEKAPNSQFCRRLVRERSASKATGFLFVALDRLEEEQADFGIRSRQT